MNYQRICAEIDISAIEKNIEGARSRIPTNTNIMAVIKADAYGHGAAAVAEYIGDKVEWFGVSNVLEALELRRTGIENPILILGYVSPEEYSAVVENNITIAMYSLSDAEKLSDEAAFRGKNAGVHIKIDTGMSRIGYAVNSKSADEVSCISHLPNIKITGLFSHFARADEKDKSSAKKQIEEFERFDSMLKDRCVNIPIRHIENSAGIMELDKTYEMVRMGIMLYGLYPSDEMDRAYKLYPAMRLVSHVSMVKTLDPGVGISYGHTYVTMSERKIATVPVGYADGYPRCLSNKADVLIAGKRCPIVGRVCMDQMMVDVSNIDSVSVGDKVVLMGAMGDEFISCDELANAAGTVNYELVCSISRRVPRVYLKSGEYLKTVSYII